jgi:hypothetical protein
MSAVAISELVISKVVRSIFVWRSNLLTLRPNLQPDSVTSASQGTTLLFVGYATDGDREEGIRRDVIMFT